MHNPIVAWSKGKCRSALLWGALLLAPLPSAFWIHRFDLHGGFAEGDDQDFLRTLTVLEVGELPQLWGTQFGWFYRPVFLCLFWLQTRLFGHNPVAFHAVSIVLHAFNACLLGVLAARLIPLKRVPPLLVSTATALLFLLYPGKEQAVYWISALSTLSAAFFYLVCSHCWLSFRETQSGWYYAGALISFFLALCSKEDALSLPVVLILIEATFYSTVKLRFRALRLAPFAALFFCYCYLALEAFRWCSIHPRFAWVRNPVGYRAIHADGVLDFFSQAFWQFLDIGVFLAGEKCSQPACLVYFHALGLSAAPRWVVIGFAFLTLAGLAIVTAIARRRSGNPCGLVLVGWVLASAAPLPLLAGSYIQNFWWRFYYIPAMPVTVLWVCLALLLAGYIKRKHLTVPGNHQNNRVVEPKTKSACPTLSRQAD